MFHASITLPSTYMTIANRGYGYLTVFGCFRERLEDLFSYIGGLGQGTLLTQKVKMENLT